MSSTNENILKSLAVLEQNLKDIDSAKEQVNNVVKTSGSLAKTIETYQTSFESLSINVKAVLDDSRKFNLDSIAKLSEQTKTFSKEIAKLTEFDVSKSLKSIESETIKQFQQNLTKPLEELDKQIKNIEKEVSKLTEYDFKDSFNNLEKQVVKQFETDLKEKLNVLDNKALELQSKIDEFKVQVSRIEKVDLESPFNHILSTLTNLTEKQSAEITKRYDEVRSQGDNIILRLDQQEKETKTLKTLIFVTLGIIIIGIVLNFLVK
jgi:predicted  nucleic acid-binding Zn-ribbon protein